HVSRRHRRSCKSPARIETTGVGHCSILKPYPPDRRVHVLQSENRSMKRLQRVARRSAAGFAALMLTACITRATGYEGTPAATTAAASTQAAAADPQEPFKEEVRALLRQEQFDRLDRLAGELVKTKARFPGGDWKSYRFNGALVAPSGGETASDEEWERHI